MPIKVTCDACGQTLTAKDEFAGRRTKCPGCGEPISIPEAVYDAEALSDDDNGYDDSEEDYDDGGESEDHDDRRPCRSCGEMIRSSAAKCRYCGEVYDRSIKTRGRRRRGPVRHADTMELQQFRREMHGLGGFWILIGGIFLLGGFGLLLGPEEVGRDRGLGVEEMRGGGLLLIMLAAVMLSAGVGTCLKHIWAVWTGLILSAILILLQLANMPQGVCCIVVLCAVLFQAKRCLDRAKVLNDAGIPLNSAP